MSGPDMHCSVVIAFDVLLNTTAFKEKSNSPELLVKHSFDWVETAAVPGSREIMEGIIFKISRKYSVLKESMFLTSNDVSPWEFESKRGR